MFLNVFQGTVVKQKEWRIRTEVTFETLNDWDRLELLWSTQAEYQSQVWRHSSGLEPELCRLLALGKFIQIVLDLPSGSNGLVMPVNTRDKMPSSVCRCVLCSAGTNTRSPNIVSQGSHLQIWSTQQVTHGLQTILSWIPLTHSYNSAILRTGCKTRFHLSTKVPVFSAAFTKFWFLGFDLWTEPHLFPNLDLILAFLVNFLPSGVVSSLGLVNTECNFKRRCETRKRRWGWGEG